MSDITYEEAWQAASPEERRRLDPLDYYDPRYEEEMEYWDAVNECECGSDEWGLDNGE